MFLFEIFLTAIVAAFFFIFFSLSKKTASNDREWNPDQKILTTAEFKKDGKVLVRNVRNISYQTPTSYVIEYNDREYDIHAIETVWFILEPFNGYIGAAHTFLSFEFKDDVFVSISVEIRKKNTEKYSASKGLFREYELMYVVADERDVIKLRSNHRKNKVFMYPLKIKKEEAQKLFLDMLTRANEIEKKPEFYNTLSNACATNIVRHINKVIEKPLPWTDYRIFIPEHLDVYFQKNRLLGISLPFHEAKEKHLINPLAEKYADDPHFSQRIRGR